MYLLIHQWKSNIRNQVWQKKLINRIFMFFGIAYLMAILVLIGLFFEEWYPSTEVNPIEKFNSFLLIFLSFDLMMRGQMQSLPMVRVLPYMRFKIRRKTIINYLTISSLWNFFNFYPFFILIPFALRSLLPAVGLSSTIFYLSGISLMIILNNYLGMLINYLMQRKFIYYLIPLGLIALCLLSNRTAYSSYLFSVKLTQLFLRGNPLVLGLLIIVISGLIAGIYRLFRENFYMDELKQGVERKSLFSFIKRDRVLSFDFLEKYGETGKYLAVEMSLIFRNKRTRGILMSIPIFLAYFVMISVLNHQPPRMIMVAMFMSMGVITYSTSMFSWESTYFDGIAARKTNFTSYVKAKYYFMIILVCIILIGFSILITILSKSDDNNFSFILSFLLFLCGVIAFSAMFFSATNDFRIDINATKSFSFQGTKLSIMLGALVYMLYPLLSYKLFKYLINETAGCLSIAIPGILFIITHDYWIRKVIIPRFMRHKYKNLEGYRSLSQ